MAGDQPAGKHDCANEPMHGDRTPGLTTAPVFSPLDLQLEQDARTVVITSPRNSSGSWRQVLSPSTPKSKNTEMFGSPPPPMLNTAEFRQLEDYEDKPVRGISRQLKTRLNSALMKLQSNWAEKTLPVFDDRSRGKHKCDEDSDTERNSSVKELRAETTDRSPKRRNDTGRKTVLPKSRSQAKLQTASP